MTNTDKNDLNATIGNTVLYAFSELDEDKLKIAFHLLFGDNWMKYQPDKDKSEEMKAIFKGGVKPCVPFENWVKCIDYLKGNCV